MAVRTQLLCAFRTPACAVTAPVAEPGVSPQFPVRSVFLLHFGLTRRVWWPYFANRLISQLVKYVPDQLGSTFAALSDPTRRAILARLLLGELTVKEIAEPFPISAPSMTKHLKVLERAGLITRSRDAQRRPCRLRSAPLREVAEWLEQYRRSWEYSMNRLDEYLGQLETEEGQKHARRKKR
jgi:DNA-binding transcriptional ArsR family regulator